MTLREQVPKPLRGPVGFASLGIMMLGATIGYIITTVGITIYFGLSPLEPSAVDTGESLAIIAIGLVTLAIGYLGWRGFNYFAY